MCEPDIGTSTCAYVQLRKCGRDLVGLCPFHGEKSPSFHVFPDSEYLKCFGCQKGGDGNKFVMNSRDLFFEVRLVDLGDLRTA